MRAPNKNMKSSRLKIIKYNLKIQATENVQSFDYRLLSVLLSISSPLEEEVRLGSKRYKPNRKLYKKQQRSRILDKKRLPPWRELPIETGRKIYNQKKANSIQREREKRNRLIEEEKTNRYGGVIRFERYKDLEE